MTAVAPGLARRVAGGGPVRRDCTAKLGLPPAGR